MLCCVFRSFFFSSCLESVAYFRFPHLCNTVFGQASKVVEQIYKELPKLTAVKGRHIIATSSNTHPTPRVVKLIQITVKLLSRRNDKSILAQQPPCSMKTFLLRDVHKSSSRHSESRRQTSGSCNQIRFSISPRNILVSTHNLWVIDTLLNHLQNNSPYLIRR